ncbi:MAG: transcription-repair coupling factor [Deltaproteobacteria bacterium]|nr:transcription-repair coupling factor [Deltaproteobacteria bacterium]
MTLPISALSSGQTMLIEGLPQSAIAYYISSNFADRSLLIVVSDLERAEPLIDELASFGLNDTALVPAEEHVPYEEVSPDARLVATRFAVRHRALTGEKPKIIVTTAAALLMRVMPQEAFSKSSEIYICGQTLDRDLLIKNLILCGYQRTNICEDEGTFAVRGGIIDIFVPGLKEPVRFDFFGDEIAALNYYDPRSQRNGKACEAVSIFPIREVIFNEASIALAQARFKELGETQAVPTRRLRELDAEISTGNYFFGIEALWPLFYKNSEPLIKDLISDDTIIIEADGDAVLDTINKYYRRAEFERKRQLERHHLALEINEHLIAPDTVEDLFNNHPRARLVEVADDRHKLRIRPQFKDFNELKRELSLRRSDISRGEILDPVVTELKRYYEKRYEVFLTCHSCGQAERLRELLLGRKIDLPVLNSLPSLAQAGFSRKNPRRAIAVAPLMGGLVDSERGIAILTDVEIFGAALPRKTNKKSSAPTEGLDTLKDLRDGDYVIHIDHGVGKYLGLKRIILNGVDGDYVHLEYLGGDKLYLPVYRLNLLQRYRGPTQAAKLDKLGSTRWQKAKQRVKDAVLVMAHELLRLQAQRRTLPGFALPPPDDHFRAFEATFPYEETPDQQRAIDDVLGDLCKNTPMDRLVCGDVGFGKTEVAVRAAYLSVLGKKQVAVMVPTTVLAEQHGMTFNERLGPQGVTIEVLSRFRSTKETTEIIKKAKTGQIDILIGTHRLLSSDVGWQNLGVLIIDEEHRFGVKHKERIKQLRAQVHCLTLTATPIPRTLHMAVTGLRELSIIQTPPLDRSAIRTEVTRFDEEIISDAIRCELHRGGQIFVVHNRVRSINAMADLIKRLVPEAKVGIGHGQMSANELEEVMVKFIHRRTDVLICTTIIESGIDIPSANTMIVNRADTFGLAQLYQIRGRIGRGRERAHALLLLPRSEKITREAGERLAVLKRFSELGSGFSIASFDLDLRGAGDLLGAEQSGNIAAVGFELYTELLAEAVASLKGSPHRDAIEPEIKIPVPAVLPENYIPEPMQRLAFYQRLTAAHSDEVIFNLRAEIEDLYGKAPEEVDNLAELMVIRRRLLDLGAIALSADIVNRELKIGVAFAGDAPVDRTHLARMLQQKPQRYRLLPSGRLAIVVPVSKSAEDMPPHLFLRQVRQELGALQQPN